MISKERIFNIKNEKEFDGLALELFLHQYNHCQPYREYVDMAGISPDKISSWKEIPCLPIETFKHRDVYCGEKEAQTTFTSSCTSGMTPSRHLVGDLALYEESFSRGFEQFYGDITESALFALLPKYLEREGSSLVYMADNLIGKAADGGFFLNDYPTLIERLNESLAKNRRTILLGVSFALLDLVERYSLSMPELIVMETGGMKGTRQEITREELHKKLCAGFGIDRVHSEYGMCEMMSQGYSMGDNKFRLPQWARVSVRKLDNPDRMEQNGKLGGINIIDLANRDSCSFIETQDMGRLFDDGRFTVEGRIKGSMLRGCNMLIE